MSGRQEAPATVVSDSTFGLKAGVLTQWETIAQSLSSIAPTATPAMVLPLVIAVSGRSSWIVYLLATVAALLVALHINVFARDSASPGSLYAFVRLELSPTVGAVAGWAVLIAYLGTAAAVTGGVVQYIQGLLGGIFLHPFAGALLVVGSVFVAGFLAYRNVELSTRFMLWIEAASITLILLLFFLPGGESKGWIDTSQFAASSFHLQPVRAGLILAIFSFVGFESATALGAEAASPLRTIPRAVVVTALLSGVFFVLSSYKEMAAFGSNLDLLTSSAAPLQLLAQKKNAAWLSPLLTVGAVISFFACTLACITAAARTALLISSHGALPARIGRSHQRNQTPHIAVVVSSIIVALPPLWLTLSHVNGFDIYGWVGTVATFGFVTAYFLVVLAAIVRLHRTRRAHVWNYLVSALTLGFLAWAFAGSLNLKAPGPEHLFAPIYALLLACGVLLGVLVQRAQPDQTVLEPRGEAPVE